MSFYFSFKDILLVDIYFMQNTLPLEIRTAQSLDRPKSKSFFFISFNMSCGWHVDIYFIFIYI